jgi:hypothetical protein
VPSAGIRAFAKEPLKMERSAARLIDRTIHFARRTASSSEQAHGQWGMPAKT